MAYDSSGGGEPGGGWCLSCKRPILDKSDTVRVDFDTDPDGARGLSGCYHKACSKVFASLARWVNIRWSA